MSLASVSVTDVQVAERRILDIVVLVAKRALIVAITVAFLAWGIIPVLVDLGLLSF